MRTNKEMQDDKVDGKQVRNQICGTTRTAAVETQDDRKAYWAAKYLRCPTQRNGSGSLNGSVSISHREGESYKELFRPSCQIQDSGSGDSVLTGHIVHGISAADHGSSGG